MADMCERCGELQAVHTHHRKLRSQGGDNSPANTARLCLPCHDTLHRNPALGYESGWLVKSWQNPEEVAPIPLRGLSYQEAGHEHDPGLPPGKPCPRCNRRIPYPKKKSSPQSKVFCYRVPVDDAAAHEEVLEAAAREIDPKFTERPHWKWALVNYAIAVVLQGARLEERGG